MMIEEVFKVGDIVKADAGWRRAMKRRGLDRRGDRAGAGRSLLGRLFRSRGREGAPPRQRGLLLARRPQGQRLRPSDRRRGRAGRPDRGQGGATRRRARHRPDPARPAKLQSRRCAAVPASTVKPLDIVQQEGPSFTVEGWKVDLAELVVSRRVHARARVSCCTRSATATASATRPDRLPRQRHRNGGAVRRPDRQPFLEERVRCRRIRPRQARQRTGARLRLPRPHPLLRHAGRRRLRPPDAS